ncbi:MAG: Nif11-like leader peptide family natural product precursor [Synergistaceae bacterium]|nr:Nif11-like leader peptide family natural product precursor [Synergistaceae bacterium]
MKEKAKKFLRAVSADEALKEELNEAKDIESMLKIAKVHGYDLTAEDFKNADMEEISEDEMKAVAGGSFCGCGSTGGGSAHNLDCYCPAGGSGKDPEGGSGGCFCVTGLGLGWN